MCVDVQTIRSLWIVCISASWTNERQAGNVWCI